MSVAVLSDLKTHLQIPVGNTTRDAQLTAILAGTEDLVLKLAADVGIQIVKETGLEALLDGGDSTRLFLPLRPVIAVTSVQLSSDQVWGTEEAPENVVEATKYRWYPRIGMIKRVDGSVWTMGAQNVRVIFSAGYDPTPVGVKHGIVTLAAVLSGQAGKEGIASEKIGDYSYSLQDLEQTSPGAYKLLAPYITRIVVW